MNVVDDEVSGAGPVGPADSSRVTAALVERMLVAVIDTMEMAAVDLGRRLGYYRLLDEFGPATSVQLASRSGTDERYAREWLEQQATAGFLTVDRPAASHKDRRYELPAAHRPVLVDTEALEHFLPVATLAWGVGRPIDELVEAYRSGAGVPYERYGREVVEAIGAANRPQFTHLLGEWVGAVPEIDQRLREDPPARIADVACGTGWSSIALARAYPKVTVDALDIDATSIEIAQANVTEAGLQGRIHMRIHEAASPHLGDTYDLITIFEALHDMNQPVAALRAARESLTEQGGVLVADERVAERFQSPGDELERLNYAFSVLHCLPVGRTDTDAAATGTVLRPETLSAYAHEAGFGRVDVLPIEHELWRFYRLIPRGA
jgi:2-polyprenyl-3-methyl-5-hydroxy-6-metoxy-1,4-benzoquinol methylase